MRICAVLYLMKGCEVDFLGSPGSVGINGDVELDAVTELRMEGVVESR